MTIEPRNDGYVLPEVGRWARQKLHFIGRYLDAFTTAMRDKWSELHYVDLFAGAGFSRVRDSDEIIAGSPNLAASTRFPFTQLHLVEQDAERAEALQHRLSPYSNPRPPRFFVEDANSCIHDVLALIPDRGALTITLADPFGLHFDFETARVIAQRRSDLIVLLADNMDALRNWGTYYRDNSQSPLDRFMGEPGWREAFDESSPENRAETMRKRYEQQLGTLGFKYFAFERIDNDRARGIYVLVYASAHPVGIKIWNGISEINAAGQHKLGF